MIEWMAKLIKKMVMVYRNSFSDERCQSSWKKNKGADSRVTPGEEKQGYYSCYFWVPKQKRKPILDPSFNKSIMETMSRAGVCASQGLIHIH